MERFDPQRIFHRQLIGINAALARSLEGIEDPTLAQAMAHYPKAGGKRLRPLLAMLAAEAVGGRGSDALPLGIAVELIHNFTLVHDDVMDKDELRRGLPTVHVVFGLPAAILAGDALFARAFEVLATTPAKDPAALRRLFSLVSAAIRTVAEGQQLDMLLEAKRTVPEQTYFEMIHKKTGALYMAVAQGGAIVAGAPRTQETALRRYAQELGLGFQIWDDYLGLTADPRALGKPVGSDLRNGKKTLIALHALRTLRGGARRRFLEIFGNPRATPRALREAIGIVEANGSLSYAERIAHRHIASSKRALRPLRPSVARRRLEQLADFMVTRDR